LDSGGLTGATNIFFTFVVFALYILYVVRHRKIDELSRRFILAGFFFGVHELTFFLGDPFVYELTKMLFFMALFYSFLSVVTQNMSLKKELDEQKERNAKLKERAEEISKSWLAEKRQK
jgi:Ca2+/Na+ antiporter